jgi:4-amino-4-deoxy-L-arabinose transferase-like glycosyltransferase
MSYAQRLALPLVLVLAAIVRLWEVPSLSAHWDEMAHLHLAWHPSLLQPLTMVWVYGPAHLPLHYLVMFFVADIFGDSATTFRLLSVLVGVAAVAVIFLTGKRFFSFKAGLIAGLLAAISPIQVWWSQAISVYPAVFLWGAISLYALLAWLQTRERKWLPISIVANSCLILCHPLATLAPLAQGIYLLTFYPREIRRWLLWGALHAPALLFAFVLIQSNLNYLSDFGDYSPPPIALLLQHALADDALHASYEFWLPGTFSFLPDFLRHWQATAAGAVGLLFAAAFLLLSLAAVARHGRTSGLLLCVKVFPILFLAVVSYILEPVYAYRFLLAGAPAFYLLLGAGLDSVPQVQFRRLASMLIVLLYAYQLSFSLAYPLRTQWAEAGAAILNDASTRGGEVYVHSLLPMHSERLFRVNNPGYPLPVHCRWSTAGTVDAVEEALASKPEVAIWLILEESEAGPEPPAIAYLRQRGYAVETRILDGMTRLLLARVRPSDRPLLPVKRLGDDEDWDAVLRELSLTPTGEQRERMIEVLRDTLDWGIPPARIGYALFASYWLLQGESDLGLAMAELGCRKFPDAPYCHFVRGIALAALHRKEEAEVAFAMAQELDANTLWYYEPIVQAALGQGDIAAAEAQWRRDRELHCAPQALDVLLPSFGPRIGGSHDLAADVRTFWAEPQ